MKVIELVLEDKYEIAVWETHGLSLIWCFECLRVGIIDVYCVKNQDS